MAARAEEGHTVHEEDLAFVDVETTGVDPSRHEMWEAAIIVWKGNDWLEHHWLYRPPSLETADPMSLRVGGFYERNNVPRGLAEAANFAAKEQYAEWTNNGATLTDPEKVAIGWEKRNSRARPDTMAHLIATLLNGKVLVGVNTHFDAAFLEAFLRAHGAAPSWGYRLENIGSRIGGYLAAHGKTLRPGASSMDAYDALGVDTSKTTTHTALGDARLVRDAWVKMTTPSVEGAQ